MNGTRRELRRWREAVQSGDLRRAHHFLNERQLFFDFFFWFAFEISQSAPARQNKHALKRDNEA